METKAKTTAGKLAEEAGRHYALLCAAAVTAVVGVICWMLEIGRANILPVKTSAVFYIIAVTLVSAFLLSLVITNRMMSVYNVSVDEEKAKAAAGKDRLEWLTKYVKQIRDILDNPNWKYYLESVAQNPTKSTHIEEFDRIIKSLLGQMVEVHTLNENGLVYDALSSRIIGDFKWAIQYTLRARAESSSESSWKARIAKIEETL